jgi:hypothetical protein
MKDVLSVSEPVTRMGSPADTHGTNGHLGRCGVVRLLAPSGTRSGTPWVTSDIILEAEIVAVSDTNESIDGKYFLVPYGTPRNTYCRQEFRRIRSLVEDTAVGPRREVHKRHQRCEFPVWEFTPNLTTKLVNVFLSS